MRFLAFVPLVRPDALHVKIYFRPECHLCDVSEWVLQRTASAHGVRLRIEKIDIDSDPDLRTRYTNDVPVIEIDGRELFRHRVEGPAFGRFLDEWKTMRRREEES